MLKLLKLAPFRGVHQIGGRSGRNKAFFTYSAKISSSVSTCSQYIENFRLRKLNITDDPNFKDVDFAYCETNLSEGIMLLHSPLNTDASKAIFVEIVEELVCADFKYV